MFITVNQDTTKMTKHVPIRYVHMDLVSIVQVSFHSVGTSNNYSASNLSGAVAPALKLRADEAVICSRLFLKAFTVLESIAS